MDVEQLFTREFPGIGSVVTVRGEVDATFEVMRGFHSLEPEDVMRFVGGLSARLVELRVRTTRVEVAHPIWTSIRTNELDPAIEELGRQYAIASRLHSVKELDYRISTGAP